MTKEKKERSVQEKINDRSRSAVIVALALVLIGVMCAIGPIAESGVYQKLRSDDYMNDPAIPFNERSEANYTFTDDFLKDTRDRLMFWAIPGVVMLAIGYAVMILSDYPLSRKEMHKELCKKTDIYTNYGFKYCPDCGIRMSRLDKDKDKG